MRKAESFLSEKPKDQSKKLFFLLKAESPLSGISFGLLAFGF
jgi:hypothetical protein